ncbi:DsbA family oxidoreductase [soil metagenome]
MSNTPAMKVEIWSDVMCPFCYIGKRNFEKALEQFPEAQNIEVEWHSFMLDPDQKSDGNTNVYQYLADRKGMSLEQSKQMHQNVANMAKDAGLTYNFDKAITANSFDAHRFSQYAKTQGLGDAAEEALFKAYFTDGKNIADHQTLATLGQEIGLVAANVLAVLDSDEYAYQVSQDVMEAQKIGVRGVPFFVLNRKYAVSGAQPSEQFLEVLQKSFGEWQEANPAYNLQVQEGQSCDVDGECD